MMPMTELDRTPRSLPQRERESLDRLLALDFPGAPEARVQAASALAMDGCACPCGSFDLLIDPTTPDAPFDNYPEPCGLTRYGAFTETDPYVDVTLWAQAGRLIGVDATYYDEFDPRGLPDPTELREAPPAGWTDRPGPTSPSNGVDPGLRSKPVRALRRLFSRSDRG
jgi:hypothetical protein